VRKFDARILTLDAQPERFLTSEKKNVTVDFFVKWRIEDVGQYFRSTRGDERNAQIRLAQIMKDGLRNEFGKRTIQEAVSGERNEIMDVLRVKSSGLSSELGIDVVDVRISRIDLPDEVSGSVYDRMRAERQRVAADFRARGQEAAERIRATADREATVILANAYRDAERVRGEGDARAAETYANAYNRDPDFFAFHRSLNAYATTFTGNNDMLVLEPDSEFFNYFGQSGSSR
jgi:membrane protease subunit HflC